MLGMGMNVANIIIIISYFTIEGSYLKQIYMVLHDTYIGYMISLSCVEILKHVFFWVCKEPIFVIPTTIKSKITEELLESVASLRNAKTG